jgi:hypothetical protein
LVCGGSGCCCGSVGEVAFVVVIAVLMMRKKYPEGGNVDVLYIWILVSSSGISNALRPH